MSIREQIRSTGPSILNAVDGLTDWRTLLLALGGVISIVLFGVLGGAIAGAARSMALGAILMFATVVWGLVVYNGVGMQVMQLLKGGERLTVGEVVIGGLGALPRLIGLGIMLALAYLGLLLVVLVVFFICKIPGVGSVIYAVAFPASVVAIGFATFCLFYVGFPLACPAIWEGKGVMDAMAVLWGISRTRVVPVIVMFILLGLLTALVTLVVWFVLLSGLLISSSLSAVSIGGTAAAMSGMMSMDNPTSMMGRLGSDMLAGSVAGHMMAAAIGSALLFGIAGGAVALVYLRGICTIYLEGAAGLDNSEEAERLRAMVAKTKSQVGEARDRVREKMAKASQAAQQPGEAPAGAAGSMAPINAVSTVALCPACNARVGFDDRFCEACGHRLK